MRYGKNRKWLDNHAKHFYKSVQSSGRGNSQGETNKKLSAIFNSVNYNLDGSRSCVTFSKAREGMGWITSIDLYLIRSVVATRNDYLIVNKYMIAY